MFAKKGDLVTIISGKDKGKQGKILKVLLDQNRLIVEKVNVFKKNTRPTRENPQGGIVEKEYPLSSSKVQVVCPKCKKQTRIQHKFLGDQKKVRACKKCGEILDKV